MKLTLSYPISSNRYWSSFAYMEKGYTETLRGAIRAVAAGDVRSARGMLEELSKKKARYVTAPTDEAKAYKEEVAWRARAAGFKEPTTKPIQITRIQLCPRTNKDGSASGTVLDLGNCWKVVEDALQGTVYVNDKQVKRIACVEYGPPTKEGALIIELEEFVAELPPLFAEAAQT